MVRNGAGSWVHQGIFSPRAALSSNAAAPNDSSRSGWATTANTSPSSVWKTAIGGSNPASERIFIRADQDLLYESFMAVMNKLQDNGFYSVALVGEDKSGLKS